MGKKNNKSISILGIIAIIVCTAITAAVCSAGTVLYLAGKDENRAAYIEASGPKEITVECGTDYFDEGATAYSVNSFGRTSPLDTAVNGSVDTSKPGTYTVTYTTMYEGTQYTDTRTVKVVDSTKPTLKATIDEDEPSNWVTGPRDVKITATDNIDGDITSKIVKTEDAEKTIYSVTDSSGNKASLLLRAQEEVAPPVIEFSDGSALDVIYTYQDEELTMPRVFAIDGNDNELTEWIQTEGTYDIHTPGVYPIRYFLKNYLGEVVEARRTVVVEKLQNPDFIENPNKVIRLTFEGGPYASTSDILTILDKYNVKATFFVSCWNAQYLSLIQNEKKAGHAVGIYSYGSDLKEGYGDCDYFRRLTEYSQRTIESYTGSRATIMRFPGGSEEGINATEAIMSILRKEVGNWGLKYYDWTIDPSNDINNSAGVYQSIVDSVSAGSSNIIRLHDSSASTLGALENVIVWGLKNGYTFIPLA